MKKYIKSSKVLNKRRIMAARDGQIVSFSELSDEQKKQVLKKVNNGGKLSELLYDWYSDDTMEIYHNDVEELARVLEIKHGISVDTSKIYWNNSSQGPYPEWSLKDVLTGCVGSTGDVDEYVMEFYGKGTDVTAYVDVYIPDEDGDYYWEYDIECNSDELGTVVDQTAYDEIMSKVDAAQEFIDNVWKLVHDVCTSYPDDEWIIDMLENNDHIEFLVDGDSVNYIS